jgi:hypothetical protein
LARAHLRPVGVSERGGLRGPQARRAHALDKRAAGVVDELGFFVCFWGFRVGSGGR